MEFVPKNFPVVPVTIRTEKNQRVITPDSYSEEMDLSTDFEELNPRTIRVSSEYAGRLVREEDGDAVRLEFSELDGDANRILWRISDPGTVSVYSGDTLLVYDRRRKWRCINSGIFGRVEVTTHTLSLQNDLLSGGDLVIRYRVELHTVTVEETELRVSLGAAKRN